ncbi:protein-methionine sulfoxide oxidase mical2b isoform X2 [Dunckerocampus dactyliophorus]|uniref:protein-methionine sulfoxide oxidase mical2b isoform X2 n=1 Tax=Dunckerocampus dactyliophorus TaxID=161453 RepID=UPI002405CA3C|nr:protein-methionine sulfoxide oxidase mical2b isoform X2 [Dunckerocampus dactyliophorus]
MAAVKALQQWCRLQCEGYRDVSINNMTTSFRDGLAFCALIHKHRPELINFESLRKENVYENNNLAFKVAEDQLGIPALLDAEDMVALKVPDRLSILTYVSQYYNYFHGRSPIGGAAAVKRPAEVPAGGPAGKKNQPVVSKVFKPAKANNPPLSSDVTRHTASSSRITAQESPVDKSQQIGTLSNKCVSCNQHVHLVQRHLVDGKLYHRNCARSLAPSNTSTPLRDAPSSVSSPVDLTKSNTVTPTAPTRLGPSLLVQKPSTPSTISITSSSPPSSLPTPAKESKGPVSKPSSTIITPAPIITRPVAAPRTSTTAAKTIQSKLKFFQAESDNKKPVAMIVEPRRGEKCTDPTQETKGGQTVPGAKNQVKVEEHKVKKAGDENSKMKAAETSKKLSNEENNNNSKPMPKSDLPKQTNVTSQAVKKSTEGGRGRVRLKVNPSILADLQLSPSGESLPSGSTSEPRARTPDRRSKPARALPNTSASADKDMPTEWRARLKPISKETKAADSTQSPAKLQMNDTGKSHVSLRPLVDPSHPSGISVTFPQSQGLSNGRSDTTTTKTKVLKTKPDFIPKEAIMKELQEIEDNLNQLEKRGVELETKLRHSEDEGQDDSLMDELMVEWFSLIRNKQVAMRRESELVYIGKTQDLEEQQPSVEQELRKLIDKPEHLKTVWERTREEQLMSKLVEIVNDRNAIVESLDEDRLREEEEDQELNKLMMNFSVKKDKKKFSMPKLFTWGSKKEA